MIRTDKTGFTFIEVLIAMLIFVLAALSAVTMVQGSVRATQDSKELSVAAWLLQTIMTETETRLETEGFDKGCDKKKEGKFPPPNENFTWVSYCSEIDISLPESAAKLAQSDESKEEQNSQDEAIRKLILQTASDYMSKSLRELHVEVLWKQGKNQRKVSASTHVARYDQQMTLPAMPSGTGSGGSP
ncbi:MAG: prepilin-type N-terminal cleavage/methylation domain-containing protein [Deltaproteobacteria bacterium]|nr:prepilin-type N-terminal cleavage/methylation domain-containing protein [Deltaproteobacteria bacterium]